MECLVTQKLRAGNRFPELHVADPSGATRDLSKPSGDHDWMMVVVYRGRHCPMCTRYLNQLAPLIGQLSDIGVDVAAVSADSAEQLAQHREKLDEMTFPLFHSLSVGQMKELGLYISDPRSPKETDHPFAEPGLFVINEHGTLQVVDLSNNPFVRPDLETLVRGLRWIRDPDNDYPIRGTHPY
ncbi:MAG: thioredoxin peroxidase [Sandaracinus sp.]|nr:thioredoxin peroxidase [Sandaracinus sp.]|tara:strand:- start:337 stop:885 length:549 start_codon:yes stop_codon:yes gene_type:complete